MGQTIGRVRIEPSFSPFLNLPSSIVSDLRCSVSEVSESGYSITLQELEKVLQLSLHEYLSDKKIHEYSNAIFNLFNSDALVTGCDEIDSFELLGTLCLTSGMSLEKKVQFVFDLFDLNEKGELCVNEVTFAFRSLVTGAKKVAIDAALLTKNEDIDQVAVEAFDLIMPDSLKFSSAMAVDKKVTRQQFCDYVINCVETSSFIKCFDDIMDEETRSNVVANASGANSTYLRLMTKEVNHQEHESKAPMRGEPWRDQLRFLRPDIAHEHEKASPPMDGLSLECSCGRNSGTAAVYTSDGDVLYAAGSMVVKIASADNRYKQEFFNEHSNRVSSLDIFKAHDGIGMGDVAASSDTDGFVYIWSPCTLSSIVTFSTRHQNGVSKLCFSPSGELLLTIGNNDLNSTIGVYKWRERRLVFAAKMPGLGFYDCSFLCSDNSFGICGKELVHFWTKSKSQEPYRHYRGAANLFPSQDHMTSIACVESAIVTGSTSGALWLWEGRVCVKRVVVFHFPVKKLFACSVGLFVSTEEGAIHLLDNDLDLQRRLDPPRRSNCDTIQSLCWESSRGKLLVGDSSNSLSEMDLNGNTKNIMSSHSTLTDFTVDNLNDNIITVGKDGFVRVWDKGVRVILQQHNLERSLSCIACTRGDKQSDKMVAVGFCRDDVCSSDKTDVAFVILRGNDLTNISHQGRNSQKTLTVCRFSNDGKLVAFGSKDCSIYVHSTDKDFSLIAKARGHSAPILTLDFGCADDLSDSATFLRSNSITGEALFWSTHAKKQTPLSQRHTRWESYSCIYGWYLEGAHGMYTEESGATITSCCPLSENSIVIGDSSGRLRVLSNPALSKESIYLQYTCHHGRIQKIALFRESLYTFGGDDSCLLKWKVSGLSWPPTMPPSLYDDYVITEEKIESQHPTVSLELATAQMEDLDFNIKHKSSNLSAKPPRPWMRSIVPPSNYTPQLGQLPGCSLVLERIHGYNGNSAQNNLQYISRGASIVYSVGKTLIRYDDEGDMQRFCHVAGKIRSLAIQQERSLCAVGQDDDEQGIVIVDLKTMNYMSLYKSAAKGIHCLDFDESGRYLLALGGNRLTIYDVDNGRKIASTLTHAAESLDAKFAARKSDKLVEVGRNFVRLWFIKGSDMRFEEAEMSSVENPTTFYTCIGWIGSDLLVGTSTGNVVRFSGTTPICKIKAHTSKITIISSAADSRFAVSAANSIKLYDSKFRCIIVIDTNVLGVRHQISSLCWHAETRKILIGTEGNEVWELSSNDGSNITKGPLVNAHASSPMSICPNPNGTTFATVSDDGFLRVWDDEITSFALTMPSRACAYSPDGRMLAVGFGKPVKDSAKTINGKWVIIDVNDSPYRIIAERRDSRTFVREMKWHSNGDRLAVGSDKIYVYQLTTETNPAIKVDITLVSTIDLNSIHFDFSMDGKYLRVNSQANELIWFEADPAIRVKEASLMKDIEWESETSLFSWNVQGTHRDGSTVRSLDCYTTEECSSVVTGSDDGVLRLYTYPCTSNRSSYLSYAGHDGAVASVVLLKGGSHVISTGENDHAVMVWRHEIDASYTDCLLSEQKESHAIDSGEAGETPVVCYAAFYDSNHQIIYPTSGVCVVLDETRSNQDLLQRHDSQIGAVAISTSRQLVSSGDTCGDFPSVRIWDPRTCTEIAVLSDSRLRGVSVLAFSPDEKRLACVCSDDNHRIFVWSTMNGEWSDAYLSTSSLGSHEQISFVQFTQTHLITGGRNNLNFWSFCPTLSVSKRGLSMKSHGETFLCGAMMGDQLVTGTSDGYFVTWDITEKKVVSVFKAHNNGHSVTALCPCPEGVVSASSDGLVTIWSSNFQKMHSFDVRTKTAVHSLDIRPHSNGQSTIQILALSGSTCLEISCITGRVSNVANIPTPTAGEISTC